MADLYALLLFLYKADRIRYNQSISLNLRGEARSMDQPIIFTGRILWEPESKVGFWLPPMPVYAESEAIPLIEQGFQPIA